MIVANGNLFAFAPRGARQVTQPILKGLSR